MSNTPLTDELRVLVSAMNGENKRLRADMDAIISALPGAYYMDPPDGGDVSIPEQVRRMADDASKYAKLRDTSLLREVFQQMIQDWYQIDGEWGPTKGGIQADIKAGRAESIRKLSEFLDIEPT